MKENEIRSALRAHLVHVHEDELEPALIVDELAVCLQSVRADIAVVNGWFSGYEIKSGNDTLERLVRQQDGYGKVFDFATVVAAQNHIEASRSLIPEWWGILEASQYDGRIALRALREPRQNPTVCPLSLAQLLWRDEAIAVLADFGIVKGLRQTPRRLLWQTIAVTIPLDELRPIVSSKLKSRQHWPRRGSRV